MKTAKLPYLFTGEGSAVDNYNSPKKQLQDIVQGGRSHSKGNWALFDKTNQQHKYIMSICRQAQWVVPHERYGEVADLDRLSDFLKSNKSPVNKPLKDMTTDDLSKTIIALEGIAKTVYSTKKRN